PLRYGGRVAAPCARLPSLLSPREAPSPEQLGGRVPPRAAPAHRPLPAHPPRATPLPRPARAAPGAPAVADGARRRARSRGDDRCLRGGGPDRERALARAVGAVPHGDRRVRGGSRARAAPRAGPRGPGALV